MYEQLIGENSEKNIEEVQILENKVTELKESLSSLAMNSQDIFNILLGLTGSGKSTFIKKMFDFENNSYKSRVMEMGKKIFSDQKNKKIPNISSEGSCTEIPEVYSANGLFLVDSPGFFDTNGPNQQILNGYANSKMFKKGSKVRIILTAEYSALELMRGGCFFDMINRFHNFFPMDFKNMSHSCMLLITKTTKKETQKDVKNHLLQILPKYRPLPLQCREFIQTIINLNNIALFPTFQMINSTTMNQIKNKIHSLPKYVICSNASISLSDSAKRKLENIGHRLAKESKYCQDQIVNEIKDQFSDKVFQNIQSIEPLVQEATKTFKICTREFSEGGVKNIAKVVKYLNISEKNSDKVKKNLDALDFCSTINPDFEIDLRLMERILNQLHDCLVKLLNCKHSVVIQRRISQVKTYHDKEIKIKNKESEQSKNKIKTITDKCKQSEQRVSQLQKYKDENEKNKNSGRSCAIY